MRYLSRDGPLLSSKALFMKSSLRAVLQKLGVNISPDTSAPMLAALLSGFATTASAAPISTAMMHDSTVQRRATELLKIAGDEVVQLSIHQQSGTAARPVRELKGVQRVSSVPGEKKKLSFTLGPDELKFWNGITRAWVVEPASFDVWVGGDSRATRHGKFNVAQ